MTDFRAARDGITGDRWASDLARASLSVAAAKFGDPPAVGPPSERTFWTAHFPDGGSSLFGEHNPGPVVSVRFADGVLVDFRPATGTPRVAHVLFEGLVVRGLRLDVKWDLKPDGTSRYIFEPWKTGVNGVDGATDVPERIKEAAAARCRRYAKDAREAIGVVAGTRRAKG